MDPIAAIDAVHRQLFDTTRDGKPARAVVAERTYPATADEVWDALTNAERIPRWLLPVSGDLRLGGHYQLEGNAGGEITACEPPRHLAVTWMFGDMTSWVDVALTASGDDGTRLRLEHTALVDDVAGQWDEFGPGAVGVGWDMALIGMALHLGSPSREPVDREQAMAWIASEDGKRFVSASSEGWREANVAAGEDAEVASEAAQRTTDAYVGAPS
jgi:uncharacterized protein YndB with AHSA1/START domain